MARIAGKKKKRKKECIQKYYIHYLQWKEISYADRKCNKHIHQEVNSELFHLLKRTLRRFILNPRTDFYVFIFGGREFQTDDPENAKLVSMNAR